VSINIFKIDEDVNLNKVFKDLKLQNPHYVVPAWISSDSSLVRVLTSELPGPNIRALQKELGD